MTDLQRKTHVWAVNPPNAIISISPYQEEEFGMTHHPTIGLSLSPPKYSAF